MNIRDYNKMRSEAAKIKHWVLLADGKTFVQRTMAEARKLILSGKAIRLATVDEMFELEGL